MANPFDSIGASYKKNPFDDIGVMPTTSKTTPESFMKAVDKRNLVETTIDSVVDQHFNKDPLWKKLLNETSAHESWYGSHPRIKDDNNNYMQVDDIWYDELDEPRPKFKEVISGIDFKRTPDGKIDRADFRNNVLASALRYKLMGVDKVPPDQLARIALWKSLYNTEKGKGTEDAFLTSLAQYDMVEPPPAPVRAIPEQTNPIMNFLLPEAIASENPFDSIGKVSTNPFDDIGVSKPNEKEEPIETISEYHPSYKERISTAISNAMDFITNRPSTSKERIAEAKVLYDIAKREEIPFDEARKVYLKGMGEGVKDAVVAGHKTLQRGNIGTKLIFNSIDPEEAKAQSAKLKQEIGETLGHPAVTGFRNRNALFRKMVEGTAGTAEFMGRSRLFSLPAGAVGAGVGAVAGGLPGASAGFKKGSDAGVVLYTAGVEGGNMMCDLVEDGVNPKLARPIAIAGGVLSGMIEVSQQGKVLKGLPVGQRIKAVLQSPSWRKAFMLSLQEILNDYPQEVGEEVMQYLTTEGGKNIAYKLHSALTGEEYKGQTFAEYVKGAEEEGKASAISFVGISGAGGLVQTVQNYRSSVKTKAKVEKAIQQIKSIDPLQENEEKIAQLKKEETIDFSSPVGKVRGDNEIVPEQKETKTEAIFRRQKEREGKAIEMPAPEKRQKEFKAVRQFVDLSAGDAVVTKIMGEEINAGEAGRRIKTVGVDGEETWTGIPSSYPDYFRDKGYTRKETLTIVDKLEKGKKLTARQQDIYEDLKSGLIDNIIKSEGYYDQEIANLAKELGYSEEQVKREIEQAYQTESQSSETEGDLSSVIVRKAKFQNIEKANAFMDEVEKRGGTASMSDVSKKGITVWFSLPGESQIKEEPAQYGADPLIEEAKKFKTVEEFVKSVESAKLWEKSEKALKSQEFAETKAQGYYRRKKTGELTKKAIDLYKKETNQPDLTDNQVVHKLEAQKSQLTDIWNKAHGKDPLLEEAKKYETAEEFFFDKLGSGKKEIIYYKIGNNNIEIVKNPTQQDIRQITKEFNKDFPQGKGEIPYRTVYDEKGNKYIFRSDKATHGDIEPFLRDKFGLYSSQDNWTGKKYFTDIWNKAHGKEAKTGKENMLTPDETYGMNKPKGEIRETQQTFDYNQPPETVSSPGGKDDVPFTPKWRTISYCPFEIKFRKTKSLFFPKEKVQSPADIAFAFRHLKDETIEKFFCVYFKKDVPIAVEALATGGRNFAIADAFDIVKLLKDKGADAFALVHNHPSGNPNPSRQDQDTTRKFYRAVDGMKIKFKGHIIIDGNEFGYILENGEFLIFGEKEYNGAEKEVPVVEKYRQWASPDKTQSGMVAITNAHQVNKFAKDLIRNKKSTAGVICLNSKNMILSFTFVPQRKITPPEIAKIASDVSAISVIVVNPTANRRESIVKSNNDTGEFSSIRSELRDIYNVSLIDAIFISKEGDYVSLADEGVLYEPSSSYGLTDKVSEEGHTYRAYTSEEKKSFKAYKAKLASKIVELVSKNKIAGINEIFGEKVPDYLGRTEKGYQPKSEGKLAGAKIASGETLRSMSIKDLHALLKAVKDYIQVKQTENIPKNMSLVPVEIFQSQPVSKKATVWQSLLKGWFASLGTGLNRLNWLGFGDKYGKGLTKDFLEGTLNKLDFETLLADIAENWYKVLTSEKKQLIENQYPTLTRKDVGLRVWEWLEGDLEKQRQSHDSDHTIYKCPDGSYVAFSRRQEACCEQIRVVYDSLLDQINKKRLQRGLQPISRRNNYVSHIFYDFIEEFVGKRGLRVGALPPEIQAVIEIIPAKGDYDQFLLKRFGVKVGLKKDFFKAFNAYSYRAANVIFNDPIRQANIWIKHIKKLAVENPGDPVDYNYIAKNLQSYVNRYVGRPTEADIIIKEFRSAVAVKLAKLIGKDTKSQQAIAEAINGISLDTISSWVYLFTLGYRIKSATKNFFQHLLILNFCPGRDLGKAMKDRNTEESMTALNASVVYGSRKGAFMPETELVLRFKKHVTKSAFTMFRAVDRKNVKDAFLAGYYQAKRQGKGFMDCVRRGDYVASNSQWLYLRCNKSRVAFWGSVGRMASIFTTWQSNYIENVSMVAGNQATRHGLYRYLTGVALVMMIAVAIGIDPRRFASYTGITSPIDLLSRATGASGLPTPRVLSDTFKGNPVLKRDLQKILRHKEGIKKFLEIFVPMTK